MSAHELSFWEHLDELRSTIIKILVAFALCTIIAFVFKEIVFDIVMAPAKSDFALYSLLSRWGAWNSPTSKIINTGLAQQFLIHMKMSMCVSLVVCMPLIIYLLFRFVSPALYPKEKHYAISALVPAILMFYIGVALSYFIIFPVTFSFLSTYQVDVEVENLISLESYISTLIMLCLVLGALFELPVLCAALAFIGLIDATLLRKCRKHAIVVILIIAAVITPTSDVFTLMIVTVPIYALYEVSVLVVALIDKKRLNNESADSKM